MKLARILAASAALALVPTSMAQVVPKCAGDKCDVVVILPAGCGSGIQVAPDPINIAPAEKVTVTWHLLNADWQFAGDKGVDGIKVYPPALTTKAVATDARKVTWDVQLKKGQIFKYDINLVKTKTPTDKCSHDPTIVNH